MDSTILGILKNASFYLTYSYGWDGAGGKPGSILSFNRMCELLFILYNRCGGELCMPDINLCIDGSFSMTFYKGDILLYVNINDNEVSYSFYLSEDDVRYNKIVGNIVHDVELINIAKRFL